MDASVSGGGGRDGGRAVEGEGHRSMGWSASTKVGGGVCRAGRSGSMDAWGGNNRVGGHMGAVSSQVIDYLPPELALGISLGLTHA